MPPDTTKAYGWGPNGTLVAETRIFHLPSAGVLSLTPSSTLSGSATPPGTDCPPANTLPTYGRLPGSVAVRSRSFTSSTAAPGEPSLSVQHRVILSGCVASVTLSS